MGMCSGTQRWYGWRQLSSRLTSSSPRFSVVHCYVQLKWALTIEGTDTAVKVSMVQTAGEETWTHVDPAGPCDLFKVLWEELGVQDRVFTHIEVHVPAGKKNRGQQGPLRPHSIQG